MDCDLLSYSEMMEYIKELKYNEIGGMYIKRRGWTLVIDNRGVTVTTNGKSDADFYIDYYIEKLYH